MLGNGIQELGNCVTYCFVFEIGVMSEKELMIRNKFPDVGRYLPKVRDVVINTYRKLWFLGCDQMFGPTQGMKFCTFDIHLDERDSLVGQNSIQRDNMC